MLASVACILIMRVGRAFLESFIHCPFYSAAVMMRDSNDALEKQILDQVRTRSEDRTYSAVEGINCREPRVSNAIIKGVIKRATIRHSFCGLIQWCSIRFYLDTLHSLGSRVEGLDKKGRAEMHYA